MLFLTGAIVFLVGWTLVVAGYRRWAHAAGVSFWRFASTYGQERTDIRIGNPFDAPLRFWRDVLSGPPFDDGEAEAARGTVRRGATTGAAGWILALVGWVIGALAFAE